MPVASESPSPDEQFRAQLREARRSGRRVPDFFVVGHAKCGTTALYEMLKRHPQLYMPRFKETQFLSRGPRERTVRQRRAPQRPQTLESYLSLFETAAPGQLAGDGSTEYLRTPATAGRIAELCPDARIIAAFREPVSFLRSFHLQLLEVNLEDQSDFRKALALEQPRRRGKHIPRNCVWPPALQYSQHVRYAEQLREYHEHFPAEQVMVLIYDDFRADNQRVVRDVLRFLGVDAEIELEPSNANPTVRVRSQRPGQLVGALSMGRSPLASGAKRALKALTSTRLRRDALELVRRLAVDTEPPAPDEQFVSELQARFRHEVVALSECLGRDLVSLWGYGAAQPHAGAVNRSDS
jgi:Sulfotransferase family